MPVLFMSAAVASHDEEFKKRGITDILAKPFDLNELLDRVKQLCPPVG